MRVKLYSLRFLNYCFYAVRSTNSRCLQKASNSYYASQISISESEQPHQHDFNEFQFDYKGVPGQALLT